MSHPPFNITHQTNPYLKFTQDSASHDHHDLSFLQHHQNLIIHQHLDLSYFLAPSREPFSTQSIQHHQHTPFAPKNLKKKKIINTSADLIGQQDLQFVKRGIKSAKAASKEEKDMKRFNQYNQGHLDYYSTVRLPIFGLSRKYERPRKRKNSEFKFMERKFKGGKGGKDRRVRQVCSVKRLDQQYFKNYLKLDGEGQEANEITFAALRDLSSFAEDSQNNKSLLNFIDKYQQSKHWAQYLQKFIGSQDKAQFDSCW